MTPKRIQRKRTRGWRMPEGAVAVTRPTHWGNPYRIYRSPFTPEKPWWVDQGEGGAFLWARATKAEAAQLAVDLFAAWLDRPEQQKLRAEIGIALRGKDLACWCKIGDPCHADILLEIANRCPIEAIRLLQAHWQTTKGTPDHSGRMKDAGAKAALTRKRRAAARKAVDTRRKRAKLER